MPITGGVACGIIGVASGSRACFAIEFVAIGINAVRVAITTDGEIGAVAI